MRPPKVLSRRLVSGGKGSKNPQGIGLPPSPPPGVGMFKDPSFFNTWQKPRAAQRKEGRHSVKKVR